MSPEAAARVGDPVAHSRSLSGAIFGMKLGAFLGLALGTVLLAGATVVTGGLLAVAIGGTLAATGGLGLAGAYIGESMMGPSSGQIQLGSPNVFINSCMAGLAIMGVAICDKESGVPQPMATGAEFVLINSQPAGRKNEKLTCSAVITDGSPNVCIGGPSGKVLDMNPEVPSWLSTTMKVMMWGGLGIATYGLAAQYGIITAALTNLGGYTGSYFGSLGGRWLGQLIGLGETGQRILEVSGGMAGGTAGGYYGFRAGQSVTANLATGTINPNDLNYSQTSAAGSRAENWRQKLIEGWDPSEIPLIDVIDVDGTLVSLDNTRLAVATELGLDNVTMRVHSMSDALPYNFPLERYQWMVNKAIKNNQPPPTTWGDLINIRILDNGLPLTGTSTPPTFTSQ